MPSERERSSSTSSNFESLTAHLLTGDESLDFAKSFWKACEASDYEVKQFSKYVRAFHMVAKGVRQNQVATIVDESLSSVSAWLRFEEKPKLGHFLAAHLSLGPPREGWVWLSINNTSGHAVPLGPFIQVPTKIIGWQDVADVLGQIRPLREASELSREYLFGFLLGMAIGDAAKSRTKGWHRHLGLVLSKKYDTNEKIGEFTCACAESFGLRMHRVADQPKPRTKPHGFYQWVSQASPLVDWVFNVCLGLKDGERTTYDPVDMDWAFDSPEEFRRGLVQGLAESDGSVNISSQMVEFWIGPNWEFVKRLLLTFGVRSFRSREALSVAKTQVTLLGRIPAFASHLRTVRFARFEKLVRARHVGHGKRIPSEIRTFIQGYADSRSVPQISEMILEKFGTVVGFETVQRWAKRSELGSVPLEETAANCNSQC
jgi:hypothetical protein